jgi:hypothetical protein
MRLIAAFLKIFISITVVIGALSAVLSFWDINFFKIPTSALPYVIPGGIGLFILAIIIGLLELRVERSEESAQQQAKIKLGSEMIKTEVIANVVAILARLDALKNYARIEEEPDLVQQAVKKQRVWPSYETPEEVEIWAKKAADTGNVLRQELNARPLNTQFYQPLVAIATESGLVLPH